MLRNQRDELMRMVAQAAAAVARLRQRLLGGDPPLDVARDARSAQMELLGRDAPMLMMLDARSAAHAVGDPDRISAWAELLRVEAIALRDAGRDGEGAQLDSHADSLKRAIVPG